MTKIIKLLILIIIVLLAFLLPGCGNGSSPAVERGDVEAVRALLAKDPALLYSRDKDGLTMLHRAAIKGRVPVAELLIASGAAVDERSHDGRGLTPLHLAAAENHPGMVTLLLEKGADIEARGKGGFYKDWTALVFAARNNHKDMADLLIRKGAALNPEALFFAVIKGHRDVVELLLDKGAPTDYPSGKNSDLLHITVKEGHTELVQLLLDHGADVNRKWCNETPLHGISSWRRDHTEITRLLLAHGAEVDALNSFRETPLHLAAHYNLPETAALLLEKGADTDLVTDLGDTPIELAEHNGHKDIVRLLVSLHTAAKKGNLTAVQKLIKTYPQLINARDLDYKTPLHLAAEHNRLEIARLLIENGAVVAARSKFKSIRLLHGVVAQILVAQVGRVKQIKDQKTPLDFALQNGFESMARLLETYMKEK